MIFLLIARALGGEFEEVCPPKEGGTARYTTEGVICGSRDGVTLYTKDATRRLLGPMDGYRGLVASEAGVYALDSNYQEVLRHVEGETVIPTPGETLPAPEFLTKPFWLTRSFDMQIGERVLPGPWANPICETKRGHVLARHKNRRWHIIIAAADDSEVVLFDATMAPSLGCAMGGIVAAGRDREVLWWMPRSQRTFSIAIDGAPKWMAVGAGFGSGYVIAWQERDRTSIQWLLVDRRGRAGPQGTIDQPSGLGLQQTQVRDGRVCALVGGMDEVALPIVEVCSGVMK